MGFFGGDETDHSGEDAINRQNALNEQELEAKRQNLFKQRLDIIKSQGAQQFTPDRTAGVSSPEQKTGFPLVNANKGLILHG